MFNRSISLMTSSFNYLKRVNTVYNLRRLPIQTCIAYRSFSSLQLNENEVIEYVEGKVFEVLK